MTFLSALTSRRVLHPIFMLGLAGLVSGNWIFVGSIIGAGIAWLYLCSR
nr:hypothetical protein [Moritella viscosa]SHO14762.1 UDP-N-acetylglucosamine--N-acetylmuramyl-(pentapeptide) pyrophosphoryl-undecaprenol N-acetylglucosamine transferase-Undecaprenyl-PP-MurNAc-pentapeptide-UDPGlcNAc GlcNAc transferase [Moritella viscosa]